MKKCIVVIISKRTCIGARYVERKILSPEIVFYYKGFSFINSNITNRGNMKKGH